MRGGNTWPGLWFAVVFVCALALYAATMQKGLSLPDSAVVMEAMMRPEVSAFACNHTLSNLVGWLVIHMVQWGSLAWRCNLVSAIYGATLAALFFTLGVRLGGSFLTVAAGTLPLVVSHGLWWHSTIAENYALSAVLLLTCAHLLMTPGGAGGSAMQAQPDKSLPPHRILALFAVAGLALLNHLQCGVLVMGCCWAVPEIWSRRGRAWRWAVAGLVLGATPYLTLAALEVLSGRAGADWLSWLLGGGGFGAQMAHYGKPVTLVAELARLWVWNWPGPFGLVALAGCLWLPVLADQCRFPGFWRLARLLIVVIAVTVAFFSGYDTWDRFSFFLLAFVAAAIGGMLLLIRWERQARLWGRRQTLLRGVVLWAVLLGALLTPFFYMTLTDRLAVSGDTVFLTRRYASLARQFQGRCNMAGMLLDPVRRDQGTIERYVRKVLDALPAAAVWLDDGTLFYQAQWLQRHEDLRSDVRMDLLAHGLMPGYGDEPQALAMRRQWRDPEGRWFLSATSGVSRVFWEALRPFGWRAEPYPAERRPAVYEVVR